MEAAAAGLFFGLLVVGALELVPRPWLACAGGLLIAATIVLTALQLLGLA